MIVIIRGITRVPSSASSVRRVSPRTAPSPPLNHSFPSPYPLACLLPTSRLLASSRKKYEHDSKAKSPPLLACCTLPPISRRPSTSRSRAALPCSRRRRWGRILCALLLRAGFPVQRGRLPSVRFEHHRRPQTRPDVSSSRAVRTPARRRSARS